MIPGVETSQTTISRIMGQKWSRRDLVPGIEIEQPPTRTSGLHFDPNRERLNCEPLNPQAASSRIGGWIRVGCSPEPRTLNAFSSTSSGPGAARVGA
jgi:hypothetical protein